MSVASADDVAAAAAGGATGGRRRAFETNLAEELRERLGSALHPAALSRLVAELGEAHEGVRHAVDARASFGVSGRKLYAVFQIGARMRDRASADLPGPLAARVLARLPDGALNGLSRLERAALAEAVERSEIRAAHPLDWRPRLRLGSMELYVNLLAGRDRRSPALAVTDDRRVPEEETLGLAALTAIAVVTAGFGLWMVGSVVAGALSLLGDPRVIGFFTGPLG